MRVGRDCQFAAVRQGDGNFGRQSEGNLLGILRVAVIRNVNDKARVVLRRCARQDAQGGTAVKKRLQGAAVVGDAVQTRSADLHRNIEPPGRNGVAGYLELDAVPPDILEDRRGGLHEADFRSIVINDGQRELVITRIHAAPSNGEFVALRESEDNVLVFFGGIIDVVVDVDGNFAACFSPGNPETLFVHVPVFIEADEIAAVAGRRLDLQRQAASRRTIFLQRDGEGHFPVILVDRSDVVRRHRIRIKEDRITVGKYGDDVPPVVHGRHHSLRQSRIRQIKDEDFVVFVRLVSVLDVDHEGRIAVLRSRKGNLKRVGDAAGAGVISIGDQVRRAGDANGESRAFVRNRVIRKDEPDLNVLVLVCLGTLLRKTDGRIVVLEDAYPVRVLRSDDIARRQIVCA